MIAGSTPAILFSISALSLYFIERCRRNITPPFCQIRGVYHYPTLLPIYSRNSAGTIFSIFSNLPNNSFTSIKAVLQSHQSFRSSGAKVLTRSSRTYKVEPWGLAKNLPCARWLRGILCQNLVRPNLYTEKPLKRNDRRDRKTHKKMSDKRAAD